MAELGNVTPEPQSVLAVCLRYLGDTLLLRPSLRALRTAFPDARIDALVASGTACALDDCPDVSRVFEWPRRGLPAQLLLGLQLARGGYSWAIDFTGNDRTALVALATRAPLRVAYDRPKLPAWSLRRVAYTLLVPPKKSKPHAMVQRLELLEACGVPPRGTELGLKPTPLALESAQEKMRGLAPGFLHAHVTSRDMQKSLPPETVREVLAAALGEGRGVVVTGGPDPRERSHVLACTRGLPADSLRVFHDLGWQELVALISLCGPYWGADTAPAHVAAAFGKPMLIHFGPSVAAHWKPLHSCGTADSLPCQCLKQKRSLCPKGEPGRCLQALRAGMVVEWLKNQASPR